MNKAELVEEVAGKVGLTKKEANNVVDAITSATLKLHSRFWEEPSDRRRDTDIGKDDT